MNPEIELRRICEVNEGEFEFEDFNVAGQTGSFVHISKYKLEIIYRNFKINILYDFGNSDTAEFKIQSTTDNIIPEFEIKTIDHFSKLILFKKRNWIVKCSDNVFKKNMDNLISNLSDLIENTAFELNTFGTHRNEKYSIQTVFSLKFQGHTESAESIINFHKSLIDLIRSKYCSCH